MPKLTDEKKWTDPWFRSLSPEFKLAWLYLIENVDIAGVIELDKDLAEFQIRACIDWDRFLTEAGKRIDRRPSGKWWIPKAAKYQLAGTHLNPQNYYHKGVMILLRKHGLLQEFIELYPQYCAKIKQSLSEPMQSLSEPQRAHKAKAKGEGEENTVSDSTFTQKKSGSEQSSPPTLPVDEFESTGKVDGISGQSKAFGPKYPGPMSKYVLPMRSGEARQIPQSFIDKSMVAYGWDAAVMDQVMRQAELWLISHPKRRPETDMRKFLTNFFNKERRKKPVFNPSSIQIPRRLESIRDDVLSWFAYLTRKFGEQDPETIRVHLDQMAAEFNLAVVKKAIELGKASGWKLLLWKDAKQAISSGGFEYEILN